MLTPDRELLEKVVRTKSLVEATGCLTVGTVRNITTSVSWLRTGCLVKAFAKRASPRRRFSRKVVVSAARCVPLTSKRQPLRLNKENDDLPWTRFGGSKGS